MLKGFHKFEENKILVDSIMYVNQIRRHSMEGFGRDEKRTKHIIRNIFKISFPSDYQQFSDDF